MKKFLIYTLTFSLTIFGSNMAFGDCNSSCTIKNGPPEVLTNYINDLHKIISNYSREISKLEPEKGLEKDYSKTKSSIQQTFNKVIDWNGYFTNFDFYVLYGSKSEYVPEIWRDYNLLERESISLEKYLKRIVSRGYDEQVIDGTKICNGVENCELSGTNLEIIGQIIKNHDAVKDYFKLSIVGKRSNFTQELTFVPKNFKDDMYVYYNENTTNNCSKCKGGFFDRVTTEVDKITNWQDNAKTGIKSWQDAIATLDGSLSKRQYERKEREVLEKDLSNKGMSINASSNVLKNLSKYNETGGFSLDNNFITNSFDYVKTSITSQIRSFSDTILQKFQNNSIKEIPTKEFSQTDSDLKSTANIEEIIAEMYNKELLSAQQQDVNTENLQSRMIELHYNLTQSIKSLDGTVKTSQKVCNSQGQGLGKCD